MAKYLTGIINFKTFAEAKIRFENMSKLLDTNCVLEKHKDGSGAIAYLYDKPIYQGQNEYTRPMEH